MKRNLNSFFHSRINGQNIKPDKQLDNFTLNKRLESYNTTTWQKNGNSKKKLKVFTLLIKTKGINQKFS